MAYKVTIQWYSGGESTITADRYESHDGCLWFHWNNGTTRAYNFDLIKSLEASRARL